MRFIADLYNSIGNELDEEGDVPRAIKAYRRAIWWDRRWPVPWYNLGLLFKRRRKWQESLTHNERAVELNPQDEAAWWNLGIAATALGNWTRAREAWRACGIDVPDGDGPLKMDFGQVLIRLNPDGDAEEVWCRRIDPARGVILNLPLPESGHRRGDVVLHDGARNGTRVVDGEELPVFDELMLLQPSHLGTFIVRVDGLTSSEAGELLVQAAAAGVEGEDWTANIRPLCDTCSKGRIVEDHRHEVPEDSTSRALGFGAASELALRDAIEPLVDAIPSASIQTVHCALPPLPIH